MKKQEMNFNRHAAYERLEAIKARLAEMANALEADNERETFTDAEKVEKKQLYREMDVLEMKIKANTPGMAVSRQSDVAEANRQLREALERSQRFELTIKREFGGTVSGYADPANSTNPAGLTVGDIVEPLYGKTILSAIGAPLLTGLIGNYEWPVVEAFEAKVAREGVALGDTKIDMSKILAKPERIGISIPVTREAIAETGDIINLVCTQYMPVAVAALLNKIMFSPTAVANATNLVGPYVNMKGGNKVTYSGDAPTFAELLTLKGKVLGSNVVPEGLCYVMTETTKALLEGTPRWDGANVAIVDDNGKIGGVPVFTTSYVDEGNILFGAFKYAPQAMFGDFNFIVDPYSQADSNVVRFVLNVDYAIATLRKEAFAMLTKNS